MTETITMEMTWTTAAQIIAAALENGTSEGRQAARAELFRMARILDELNAQKHGETDASVARFDVIAGPWSDRPALGQTFATEKEADAYAEAMRGNGIEAEALPAFDAVTLTEALELAADHFGKPDLATSAAEGEQ